MRIHIYDEFGTKTSVSVPDYLYQLFVAFCALECEECIRGRDPDDFARDQIRRFCRSVSGPGLSSQVQGYLLRWIVKPEVYNCAEGLQ